MALGVKLQFWIHTNLISHWVWICQTTWQGDLTHFVVGIASSLDVLRHLKMDSLEIIYANVLLKPWYSKAYVHFVNGVEGIRHSWTIGPYTSFFPSNKWATSQQYDPVANHQSTITIFIQIEVHRDEGADGTVTIRLQLFTNVIEGVCQKTPC